jgi:hypothetical protein
MKCITWRFRQGGLESGQGSCPMRLMVYALRRCREGIAQRRDTRDDTPAYRFEEERSNLNSSNYIQDVCSLLKTDFADSNARP